MKQHINLRRWALVLFCGMALLHASLAFAAGGRLVEEVVHSAALEGNLLGDSPDRNVTVYLPPGYDENPGRRYPVIYLLHGYTGTNALWTGSGYLGSMNIQEIADRLVESGTINPMLIIMPDARNKYRGSMYTNSPVTGNWEDFVVQELVAYIDGKYRTLDRVESRGIAGHSMGGYGALKLAMKHPEIYSAVYGISACCLGFVDREADWTISSTAWPPTLQMESADQFASAGFASQAQIALAAAFSPNADHPPFYADFPFELADGKAQLIEPVWERWIAHTPLGMLESFGSNLRQLRAVRFDVGTADGFPHIPTDSRAFSLALDAAGIPHMFQEYEGDHLNRIAERIETEVLPFFSQMLRTEAGPTAVQATSWGHIKATATHP
jgi:enterochelin esterase-like enzyme